MWKDFLLLNVVPPICDLCISGLQSNDTVGCCVGPGREGAALVGSGVKIKVALKFAHVHVLCDPPASDPVMNGDAKMQRSTVSVGSYGTCFLFHVLVTLLLRVASLPYKRR